MSTFADRIKSFRKGASTSEFAKILGISSGALNNYERGISVPSGKKLIQISERIGVSVEWLLDGAELKEKNIDMPADLPANYQGLIASFESLRQSHEKTLQLKDEIILANERTIRAQEQTIKLLEEKNLLQSELIEQLQQRPSLSADADDETPQQNTA